MNDKLSTVTLAHAPRVNDSNAVLITLVLSWVNNFCQPILYFHLSVLQKLKEVRVGYGSLNERSWAEESI